MGCRDKERSKDMASPRLTVGDLLRDMRSRGFNISQKTLYEGVEAGCFPFIKVLGVGKTGRRNLLIMRRDYETWANEYLGGINV